MQADKKVVVAGATTDAFAIARFASKPFPPFAADVDFPNTGAVTVAVGTGASKGSDVVLDGNQKIVVAGTAVGDLQDFALVRLSTDGTLDTTFATGGKQVARVQAGADDVGRVTTSAV